ncbi:monoamine oxidase-like protein A [Paraphoma chrysanthemicola]|uniref:Amine oxidase n=1 Tax=Paraphoma chrysanthemicola TaxID=798071 RepID=A0A8K0VTH4_9PLEO|nr:monoamine oxidase-like protein A [Paraphoma chrysanthemicola]
MTASVRNTFNHVALIKLHGLPTNVVRKVYVHTIMFGTLGIPSVVPRIFFPTKSQDPSNQMYINPSTLLSISLLSHLTHSHPSSPPNPNPSQLPPTIDTAIIGAGLAGLSTAHHILSSRPNTSLLILEARSRVGGKVHNYALANGGVTEVGAEFVGPTQDAVLGLINELGLKTFTTYNAGKNVVWRNGSRIAYDADPMLGGAPPVGQDALVQIASVQAELNTWAASLNVSAPWDHARAKEWDSKSLGEYLTAAAPLDDANFVLTTAVKAIFAAEPREISLLYVLAYIASAGNETTVGDLGRLVAVGGGAQESRVVGGTGLIPQRLAERIGYERIVLDAAVSSITKTSTGYDVVSRRGTVHAKKVVLAMAPPLLNHIRFSPPLPESRQALNRQMKMPRIGKGIAVYSSPFWRDQAGLNAQVVSDQGVVRVCFDSSPEDASFGAILGFILGNEMGALDATPASKAQQVILDDYTRYYGTTARNVTEFVLYRWDLEEWSKGGPVAVAPPNVLSQYGHALRETVGGLHFAGTETSEYWTGYMDGAIRSGARVAKEILEGQD